MLMSSRKAAPKITKIAQLAGRRVGVVLSGGNLDGHLLTEILAGRTPAALWMEKI